MKKQPEITDATRNKILDAFWILFRKQPLEKITIANLSYEAGIHRSSFYRYFADIYQVFELFQANTLLNIKSQLESIQANTDITLPAYTEKISILWMNSADKIYRLLNYPNSDFKKQFTDTIRPNIEKYLHFERKNPYAQYVSDFVIASIIFNFTFWYEHKDTYALQQLTALGQSIILRGVPTIQLEHY